MCAATEEIARLVEQAVTQSGTYQDAQKTIDEERVEQLVLDFLFLVKFFYNYISQQQSYKPAKGIPAYGERTETKCHLVGVPDDI
jgi:hypothetical protein